MQDMSKTKERVQGMDAQTKKQLEKLAQEKFGNLAGIAQQYLFYWKREA